MVVFFPREHEVKDLALASNIVSHFQFGATYIAWTHANGPSLTTGPFPYALTIRRDETP